MNEAALSPCAGSTPVSQEQERASDRAADRVIAEIAAGQGITLSQGARRFPSSRGRGTNTSTVFRWLRDGVQTPDGRRVKLEAARCGSRWLTTEAAIRRFIGAQQPLLGSLDTPEAGRAEGAAPSGPRTPTQRRRAAERAGEELARRYGI
jgi:hypothetical protein